MYILMWGIMQGTFREASPIEVLIFLYKKVILAKVLENFSNLIIHFSHDYQFELFVALVKKN